MMRKKINSIFSLIVVLFISTSVSSCKGRLPTDIPIAEAPTNQAPAQQTPPQDTVTEQPSDIPNTLPIPNAPNTVQEQPSQPVVETPVNNPVAELPNPSQPVVETPVNNPVAELPNPSQPVAETPVNNPVAELPNPSQPVVETPVNNPVAELPNPSQPVVETPVNNPVAVTPAPQPPTEANQPTTNTAFFDAMKAAGFNKTNDQIVSEIKNLISLKIIDWSNGVYANKDKNIENHFTNNQKYFNPPLSDPKIYYDKSMLLANKNEGVHFYVEVRYGPKSNTINLLKVDPQTLEVLYFNNKGLVTNYTQTTQGGLLKLTNSLFIPSTIYVNAVTAASVKKNYYRQYYYNPFDGRYTKKF